MTAVDKLLLRLNEIGVSLSESRNALALLSLGSVGNELERLDEYSDLDFFVIVKEGYKQSYIEKLDWLEKLCPIAFAFMNTNDGYKLMYEDGIFCEFAIFCPAELPKIPFSKGRIIWKDQSFDDSICIPKPIFPKQPEPTEWIIGEALTNLYVGLCRYQRGEKLSASRFIENYALDRILDLAQSIENEQNIPKDIFSNDRRLEFRFPSLAKQLPYFMQGYNHIQDSAREILNFLDTHYTINVAMKERILALCDR